MRVILLEKIHGLGGLGDTVTVKPGFGRNCLIPQGKAVSASEANLAKFEAQRVELERHAQENLRAAQTRATALTDMVITIPAKAGEEGKLFGSLGTADLANAITARGVSVVKSEISLPTGPLRALGEYDIALHLHADITLSIKVQVVAE